MLHVPQFLRFFHQRQQVIIQRRSATVFIITDAAFRPLDREVLPGKVIHEGQLVFITENHGDAARIEALVQMVGPGAGASRDQTEMAVTFPFQVVPHKASDVNSILQIPRPAEFHQFPAHRAVAIGLVDQRRTAVEGQQQAPLGGTLVVTLHVLDPRIVRVPRDHQVLPAGEAVFHVHVASQRLAPGGTAALWGQKHRGAAQQVVAVPNAWTLPICKEENVIGAIQAMKMPRLAEEVHHGVKDKAVRDLIHVEDEVLTDIFVQLHVEAGGVKGHVKPIGRIRIVGLAVVAKILVQQHFGTPLPLQAFKGATIEVFGNRRPL